MASTNKTANYELNQWAGTDRPKWADLNADNLAIDTQMKANADAAAGKLSPDGDGTNLSETFTEAEALENINTGDIHATIFGKIKKWFASLGTAAFTDSSDYDGAGAANSAIGAHDTDPDAHTDKFSAVDTSISALTADVDFNVTNLITNGDFSNGTAGWSALNSVLSVESNILSVTGSGASSSPRTRQITSISPVIGKTYYIAYYARVTNSNCTTLEVQFAGISGGTLSKTITSPVQNQWYKVSNAFVVDASIAGNVLFDLVHRYADAATASGKVMEIKYVLSTNLTNDFCNGIVGTGNEPTATQMDEILSYYDNSWFDGNVNLASNPKMLPYLLNKARRVDELNSILSDTTFNADWVGGTPTIDYTTGIITLASHGISNNEAVEFDAGTGVLPTGILPYDSDVIGGTYYNLIYIDANTFKITATLGGSTPVLPTDNGTSGWRIRRAGTAVTITGLDLTAHKEYDVFVIIPAVKNTTTGSSLFLRLNNSSSFKYFSSTAFGTSVLSFTPTVANKYTLGYLKINVRYVDTDKAVIKTSFYGQSSSDKSTSVASLALDSGAYAYCPSEVTSIALGSNNSSNLGIRNGTRAVVVRRG